MQDYDESNNGFLNVGNWEAPAAPVRNVHGLDLSEPDSFFEVVDLLRRIPKTNWDDYRTWLSIGAACKNISPGLFEPFRQLSQQSEKYQDGDCERLWESLKDDYRGTPATIGTLRHLATAPQHDLSAAIAKLAESLAPKEKKTLAQPEFVGWGWDEFQKAAFTQNYIVEDCVSEFEVMAFGGPQKTCKTILLADMAVGLASGSYFLSERFPCEQRVVTVFSGETTPGTLRERMQQIAKFKGVSGKLNDDVLQVYTTLPQFDRPLDGLKDLLKKLGTQFLAIDPLARCIDGQYANNVFSMYRQLGGIMDLCAELKITLSLSHHSTQAAARDRRPMELSDLTWAGLREAAAQWILLARREAYADDGNHKLWLRAGGRAGHSNLYNVDIEEGTINSDSGRFWKSAVQTTAEANQVIAAVTDEQRHVDRVAKLRSITNYASGGKVEWPLAKTPIATICGVRSGERDSLIQRLLDENTIELVSGAANERGAKYQLVYEETNDA